MQRIWIRNVIFVTMLTGIVCAAGCKVEKLPTREQQNQADEQKKAQSATAAVAMPVPNTDNAAAVIAACGPATSDQVISINDKNNSGSVRRMIYNSKRPVTLDFIPLQAKASSVWRFNEALVDNQKLLTAENIKVYLPCAATALAKEF